MKSAKVHAHLFLRFALVGATGVLVNLVVLWLCVSQGHLNYLLGECIAAGVAAGSNYSLNVGIGVIVPQANPLKGSARVKEIENQ